MTFFPALIMPSLRALVLVILALSAAVAVDLPPHINHWLGTQRTLVVQINFTDRISSPPTPARVQEVQDDINVYLLRESYGRTALRIDEVVAVTLPTTVAANTLSGERQGYAAFDILVQQDPVRYDRRNWDRIWFIGYINLGSTGLAQMNAEMMWIGFGADGYFRHELMHTYGLGHVGAGAWSGGSRFLGANLENGDVGIGGTNPAAFRISMGWMQKNDPDGFGYTDLPLTAASSGVRRIYATESQQAIPGGTRALRLPRAVTSSSDHPFYCFALSVSTSRNGLSVHRLNDIAAPPNNRTRSPIRALGRPWLPRVDGIDTFSFPIGRTIAMNQPGENYFVTPLTAIPAANGLPDAIDVDVRIGPFPGNRTPVATLAASRSTVAVGELVTLAVNASDADGDALAYHWDFGDGAGKYALGSALLTSVAKSWSAPGRYRVEATVSDRKGGVYIVAMTVTVGTPAAFTISGRAVTQANGPAQGQVAWITLPGGAAIYSFTDAAGRYALNNVPPGDWVVRLGGLETTEAAVDAERAVTVDADLIGIDFTTTTQGAIGSSAVFGYARIANTASYLNHAIISNGVVSTKTGQTSYPAGYYRLSGLPAGPSTLTATHPYYDSPGQSINLITNQTLAAIDFTMTPRPTSLVRGTVRDQDGAPVQYVGFRVDDLADALGGASSAAGTFSLSIPRGQRILRPTNSAYTFTPATRTINVGTSEMSGVDFTATRVAPVSGRVTYQGNSLPGVRVQVGNRATFTDGNGLWRLSAAVGPRMLTYSLAGYSFTPNAVELTVPVAGLTGLVSAATYVDPIRLISGTTYLSGGTSTVLPGVTVTNGVDTAVSGSDGRFTLATTQAQNALRGILAGYSSSTRNITVSSRVDGQDLSLTPTATSTIAWSTASLVVAEGGLASLQILRSGANDVVTATWTTANGTALAGSDFTAGSGTVTFATGETSKAIAIPVLADGTPEAAETFTLRISAVGGTGVVLGSPNVCTVTIPAQTTGTAPVIISQPSDRTIRVGQTASFSVDATGTPAPTIQWQRSPDGTNWSAINGATSASYITPIASLSDHQARFRAVATNSIGSVTSMSAQLSVRRRGDANLDGAVDILDLIVIRRAFGTATVAADLNEDGTVDILDLILVRREFGL